MINCYIRKAIDWTLYLFIGIVFWGLSVFGQHIYYSYMPVDTFIDFQKLDFQDYEKGDKVQILYSYRNNKQDIVGDFLYKVYCNGKNKLDWTFETKGILLNKTKGDEIKKIEMPVVLELEKGECNIYAYITFDIHGIKREISLDDNFMVK